MPRKFLNMITFNVRSLIDISRRVELIKILIENKLDFAFIQETHLSKAHKVSLENFDFVRDNSSQGVGIAIRNDWTYSRIEIPNVPFPTVFIEIILKVNLEIQKILLGSIYIPCNSNQSTISNGLSRINSFSQNYNGCIIGGDLNAKHTSWGDISDNINGKTLNHWVQNNALDFARICFDKPSFSLGVSFLDHFLISTNLINTINNNFNIKTLPSFSDHFPLFLKLILNDFDLILKNKTTYKSFQNTDWKKFKKDLDNELELFMPPHDQNLSNEEIDSFVEYLSKSIVVCVKQNSTNIELKNRKYIVSDEIKNLYKIKYKWQKQLKNNFYRNYNRNDPQYTLISKQIQLLNIIIKEKVSLEQEAALNKYLKTIKPGPNAFKQIFKIVGKNKFSEVKEIEIDGVRVSTEYEIVEKLRSHYNMVYSENIPDRSDLPMIDETISSVLSNIPASIKEFSDSFSSLHNNDVNYFISPNSLRIYIKSINTKKSAGKDDVSNFILKKSSDLAIEFMTIIFNNCINNGYFPNMWKIGKIVPIKKSNTSISIGNLRPISMLSNVGKLFEKILRDKMDFSMDENYISDFQFGFKKEHSAVHALLKFQNDVVNNLRTQTCTVAVSLDIEKAFDRVYHKGLLYKLIRLGFDPFIIKIFNSFLSDRRFFVQIGSTQSDLGSIQCGVPQGSLLAPHLYNIFVYDFPHIFEDSKAILYADDSLLYAHNLSPKIALKNVEEHLYFVWEFYKSWGIKINSSKSVAICIRNASGKCGYKVVPESKSLILNLNEENIPFKDNFKYLGVNFNNLFKFNSHVRKSIAKCQRIKGMFSGMLISKYLQFRTKRLLYKTCIRPVLMYAFPIWFSCSPTVMKEVEILERKVLRLCVDRHYECYIRKYSNYFIYQKADCTPFAKYAFSLMDKFIKRVSNHCNPVISSIYTQQKDIFWNDFGYLSPISLINEDQLVTFHNDAPLLPEFYSLNYPNIHRG